MADGDALLRGILTRAADDAPRLVYADWLDENGQPDRAAFIRRDIDTRRRRRSRAKPVVAARFQCWMYVRRNGEALGSIAFRVIAPDHAEMKRLFVRAEARGGGLGRRLIDALEQEARRRGIDRISLETGIRQPEAIALYRASGYRECPPFGSYAPDPLSLFMTKPLGS